MSPFGEAYNFFSSISVSPYGSIKKIDRVNVLFNVREKRVNRRHAAIQRVDIFLRQCLARGLDFIIKPRFRRLEGLPHVVSRWASEWPIVYRQSDGRPEFGTASASDLRLLLLVIDYDRAEFAQLVGQVVWKFTWAIPAPIIRQPRQLV